MKRTLSLLPILLLAVTLLLSGCGSSAPAGSESPAPKTEPSASPAPSETASQTLDLPCYPDLSSFLHGMEPVTDDSSTSLTDLTFALNKGLGPLGKQYVELALSDPYEFSLISSHETDKERALYENYYLAYTGSDDVGAVRMQETCQLYVGVHNYKNKDEVHIRVVAVNGLFAWDNGDRADLSAFLAPAPSPAISPSPSASATPSAQPQASSSVSASSTLLPDLSSFYSRSPSAYEEDNGGMHLSFSDMPYSEYPVLLEETLALLQNDRYQLELVDTRSRNITKKTFQERYDFHYTGSRSLALLTDGLDEGQYHVQLIVTRYTKAQEVKVSLNFCTDFQLEDPGTRTSASVAGGGSSGGGSSGGSTGRDPNVADFARLDCLTCHGDGDCNKCNGYGYIWKDDIRSDCTRCSSGNCPACGGSGKR